MVILPTLLILSIGSLFALHFPSTKENQPLLIQDNPSGREEVVSPLHSNTPLLDKEDTAASRAFNIFGVRRHIESYGDPQKSVAELVRILERIALYEKRRNTKGLNSEEENNVNYLYEQKDEILRYLKENDPSSWCTLMRYPLYRNHTLSFPEYFDTMTELPHSLAFMKVFPEVHSWRGISKIAYPLALTARIVNIEDVPTVFQEKVNAVVSNAKIILQLLVKASGFKFSIIPESFFNTWSIFFKNFYGFFNNIGLIYSSFWSSLLYMIKEGDPLENNNFVLKKLSDATNRLLGVGLDAHKSITGRPFYGGLYGDVLGSFLKIDTHQIESQLETHARIFDSISSLHSSQDHLAYVSATREIIANIRGMSEDVKQLLSDDFPFTQRDPNSPPVFVLLDRMVIKTLKFTPIINTVLNEKSVLFPLLMAIRKKDRVQNFLPFFIKYSDPSFDSDFPELFNVERKDGQADIETFNRELKNLPSTVWKHPYSVLFSMLDPYLPLNAVLEEGSEFLNTMKKQNEELQLNSNRNKLIIENVASIQMHSMEKLKQMIPLLKGNFNPSDPLKLERDFLSTVPMEKIEQIYTGDDESAKIAREFLKIMFGNDFKIAILNHFSYIRMRIHSDLEYNDEDRNEMVFSDQFTNNAHITEIQGIQLMYTLLSRDFLSSGIKILDAISKYVFLEGMWNVVSKTKNP